MYDMTPKYFGDQLDANGAPLTWGVHPGGLPTRYPGAKLLTPDEREQMVPVLTAHYSYFRLPDDVAKYMEIKDRIINGRFWLERELTNVDETDPKVVHIHMWWANPEAAMTPAAAAARGH